MEKRRATYDLNAVKVVLGSARSLAMTSTALRDATALGFDRVQVAQTIRSMENRMFYKSMTTIADCRVWQDVYHVESGQLLLYVKIQADIITDFKVISFKER